MARLSREQSQQRTREKLLEAAREIFARNGYAEASLEEIAEHAGYSKGAVYSNFESKEALFLELLQGHMSEEIAELQELLGRGQSAEETLLAFQNKYTSGKKHVTWWMLSTEFQLMAGRKPEFAKPFAALYKTQRKAMAELVRRFAQRAGVPAPKNAEEVATTLMGMSQGIALQYAADPRAVSRSTACRATEVFLKAILGH